MSSFHQNRECKRTQAPIADSHDIGDIISFVKQAASQPAKYMLEETITSVPTIYPPPSSSGADDVQVAFEPDFRGTARYIHKSEAKTFNENTHFAESSVTTFEVAWNCLFTEASRSNAENNIISYTSSHSNGAARSEARQQRVQLNAHPQGGSKSGPSLQTVRADATTCMLVRTKVTSHGSEAQCRPWPPSSRSRCHNGSNHDPGERQAATAS